MQAATTLKHALKNLDSKKPLDSAEDLASFFVGRENSPCKILKADLDEVLSEQHTYYPKYLFTGHMGTGKSTELARLERELQDDYCVIRFSARNYLDIFDVEHIDVLLAIIFAAFHYCGDRVKLSKDLERRIVNLMSFGLKGDITTGKDKTIGGEFEIKAGKFLNGIAELGVKFKVEAATRKDIRQEITHRTSDIYDAIDDITRAISESLNNTKVIFIVEDLDKIDIDKAEKIFYKHANSLTSLRTVVIYTFPIALRHSGDYQHIKGFFEIYDLPNFKTSNRDDTFNSRGFNDLKKLLLKRIVAECFEPEALDALIHHCGGLPRFLIRLARSAVMEAYVDDRETVSLADAEEAIASERRDFSYSLNSQRKAILREVIATKEIQNDEEYRKLLHNLSIIQYSNHDAWYNVHPIMKQLL